MAFVFSNKQLDLQKYKQELFMIYAESWHTKDVKIVINAFTFLLVVL